MIHILNREKNPNVTLVMYFPGTSLCLFLLVNIVIISDQTSSHDYGHYFISNHSGQLQESRYVLVVNSSNTTSQSKVPIFQRPKRESETEEEKFKKANKQMEAIKEKAWQDWKKDSFKTWTTLGQPLYLR